MQNKDFLKKVWNNIQIKMQSLIKNQNFYENFFLKTTVSKVENKMVILESPNNFSKEVLEKEYLEKIEMFFLEMTNENIKVNIVSKENLNKNIKVEQIDNINSEKFDDNLNYKLNFDNFIVGDFNKKMYKAAIKICDDNKSILNPFFIYGNTGLGKTHLINAIGIKLKEKKKKVVFLNSEDFIQEAYKNLPDNNKGIEEFKNSFNQYDVLIIDDIQFISNKNKINELFFTIFNRYIKNGKMIIMSSDRVPNELKIDSRMISRLNSGLSINILKPDIDTIYKIIKAKLEENNENINFTETAIKFIANRFNSDIRSLEGVINKVFFHASIDDNETQIINEEKIKEILDFEVENGLVNSNYKISPNLIIENIAISYGINKNTIISKIRKKEVAFARQICIYIMRELMNMSYAEIGTYFSNRDHSTILESYKKIKNNIDQDEDLRNFINNIIKNI